MFDFITNPGGGQIVLMPHVIVFYIAYRRWLKKEIEWRFWPVILDILGAVASFIAFVLAIFLLFDVNRGSLGSYGGWYLIYTAMTLGLFVLLTHTIFYLSGRLVGRIRQLWRLRKLGKTLGRQTDASSVN